MPEGVKYLLVGICFIIFMFTCAFYENHIKSQMEAVNQEVILKTSNESIKIRITEVINNPIFIKYGGCEEQYRSEPSFYLIDKDNNRFTYKLMKNKVYTYYFHGYEFYVINVNNNEIEVRFLPD